LSDEEVDRIKAWFAHQGYELWVHSVSHGGFFAPYFPVDSRGGVARFTWGRTALEAAEAAQAEFSTEQQRRADATE
jgi:hypothetical protein